ncbi:hypothetical protein FIBSPDRAFT_58575 [Athelia psychrophila]|uniref:Uncharacterized protein n=1 Tax=Athelia psychrophila TaxID=1759441 RepID=A0A166F8L2_9AGAM|nr:hypothetical protein FIBSPDRAFT_58575 [Fibularhizoctonia sp. CBS 109695]
MRAPPGVTMTVLRRGQSNSCAFHMECVLQSIDTTYRQEQLDTAWVLPRIIILWRIYYSAPGALLLVTDHAATRMD